MEQLLHYVWKHKMLPLKEMKTTKGLHVEVIDSGLHNMNSGPDFFNAKIKIDETLWVGNVEIHDKASDWYLHKHDKDERYNGDDTTPYLNELESLHKYLKESGNEAAADKISMILEKGAADLRLPKVKEFASAEEASKYNTEALYCCKYYLDHPITAPKISEACLFFDNWNRLSKDVTVPYSDFENDICQSTSGTLCFLAFEASIISNGLRYNTRFDKNIYLAAIIKMTKFYINNKEFIGIVPTLEPFAEAYSPDKLKIIKLAETQYDALRKVMKGLPK